MTSPSKRKGDRLKAASLHGRCACGCGERPRKPGAEYIRGHRPVTELALLFWPKVQRGQGCWEWQAALRSTGYGEVYWPGHGRKKIAAHRASWLIHYGDIPDGLWVLHKCDNKLCVRPDHLFLGTHRDNVDDAVRKGIIKATRARGERSGNARLTDAQVTEIRERHRVIHPARKTGCSSTELAREFGITRQYVTQLVAGKWRVSG